MNVVFDINKIVNDLAARAGQTKDISVSVRRYEDSLVIDIYPIFDDKEEDDKEC